MTLATALAINKDNKASLYWIGPRAARSKTLLDQVQSLSAINLVGQSRTLSTARTKLGQICPDIILYDPGPVIDAEKTCNEITSMCVQCPQIRLILFDRGEPWPVHCLDAQCVRQMTMPKDSVQLEAFCHELLKSLTQIAGDLRRSNKERNVGESDVVTLVPGDEAASEDSGFSSRRFRKIEAILVASSTGGPDVLATYLLPLISSGVTVPILLVQHIPAQYSSMLATHLEKALNYSCAEAMNGEALQDKRIYIAPGDQHMRLKAGIRLRICLDQSPPVQHCRPSADVLFASAAAVLGRRVLAVVLTGMGSDGCNGARQIVEAGGHVLAQDQNSSAVWGMPGAVVAAGLARYVDVPKNLARLSCSILEGE